MLKPMILFLLFFVATAAAGQQFGDAVDAAGAISYQTMLEKMHGQDSLATKVAGTVETVCQMKGCWMTIAGPDGGEPRMTVKFKDYGFFVPKDIAGRRVIVEGYAYREVTTVDELKHLAEDAGKSKAEIDAITRPKEELKFLASGVLLLEKGD